MTAIIIAVIALKPSGTPMEPPTLVTEETSSPESLSRTHPEDGTAEVVHPIAELIKELRAAAEGENNDRLSETILALVNYLDRYPEQFEHVTQMMAADAVLAAKIGFLIDAAPVSTNRTASRLFQKVALTMVQTQKAPAFRLAALTALGNTPETTTEAMQAVARLGVEDLHSQVRHSAVAIIGEWLSKSPDPVFGEDLNDQLIWVIGSSIDPDVRAQAAQVLARQNPQFPAKVQEALVNYLQTVPTPQSRMLVVMALGAETEARRAFALEQLEQACAETSDPELKRRILFETVRLGKEDASQILTRLSHSDPTLAQDSEDYLALLRSGVTDADEIHDLKSAWDAERLASQAPEEPNHVPVQ